MDQNSAQPKQQVVESLKEATNVLVTVSRDPSVDQLAACIGLTLMLNKLGKHATAVFSGKIPSTIEFLQPEKTIETNTDSLRDFIISLDRSKADKLRYKVEDDVVKIFITPYRTSLGAEDLQFSQGDFNVDVVVALGVDQREHLDEAIVAHGRILHDAKVVGLSYGDRISDIGGLNWHEATASSLSEMLVSISEAFQSGILDAQMATAYLTGIVAETDRFKNQKTTPKVMTMSAQLMAAGANQQLIAEKLAIADEPELPEPFVPIAEQVKKPVEDHEEPVEPKSDTFSVPKDEDTDSDSSMISLHEEPEVHSNKDKSEDQILIDDDGNIHDTDDQKPKQKVIEPITMKPPETPKTDLNNYVFEEPSQGGTFTANTEPEEVNPIIDALAATPPDPATDTPILNKGPAPTQQPVKIDELLNSMPPITEQTSPVTPVAPPTPPPPIEQPMPNQDIANTADPTINLPDMSDQPSAPAIDEDAARQAVLNAVNSADYQPPRTDPIAALNAAPMPLDQPMISPQPIDNNTPPPVVPPPMMPTDPNVGFPLPGQDQQQ